MRNLSAVLLTLAAGIFFLFGFILVKFVKKKRELSILATGMALVVMLGMTFFDLMPEILEISETVYFGKWQKLFVYSSFYDFRNIDIKSF